MTNYPVAERGYRWLLCSQTFLVFGYYQPTKPSPSTTLPRVCVWAVRSWLLFYRCINNHCTTISSQTLCLEARRKCGDGFIHTQLASSYVNAPQQFASSPSTVGFITRDFHALISRQRWQTNRRGLHTLILTSKTRCMQKFRSVDALLTTQNVLSWSGRFSSGHIGWSQLQSHHCQLLLCIWMHRVNAQYNAAWFFTSLQWCQMSIKVSQNTNTNNFPYIVWHKIKP